MTLMIRFGNLFIFICYIYLCLLVLSTFNLVSHQVFYIQFTVLIEVNWVNKKMIVCLLCVLFFFFFFKRSNNYKRNGLGLRLKIIEYSKFICIIFLGH